MPQLDTVTYVGQVFWLLVTFFTYYIIVLKRILPTISRIIKTRSKKAQLVQQNTKQLQEERVKTEERYNTIMLKSLKQSADSIQRSNELANKWVETNVKAICTQPSLAQINQTYIKTVGDIVGRKHLVLKLCKPVKRPVKRKAKRGARKKALW